MQAFYTGQAADMTKISWFDKEKSTPRSKITNFPEFFNFHFSISRFESDANSNFDLYNT